ncbi:MAG: hypothetical protein ACKO3N_08475, partial [Verrucomicrobiota bacterium]
MIPGLAEVNTWRDRLVATLEPLVVLVGNRALLAGVPGATAPGFLATFLRGAHPAGPDGPAISEAELAALLAAARPADTGEAEVRAAAARWNRTQEYERRGIRRQDQVPAGESPDFLDRDPLARVVSAAVAALEASRADGFADPGLGLAAAVERMKRELSAGSGGGVCARVRVRLDQDVVQARQGFRATLELVNDSGAALEDVQVELEFTDATGAVSSPRFALLPPELANLGAVDGTGRVNAAATGTAAWTIIPGPEAAPGRDRAVHFVSGVLQYRQGEVVVRQVLAPVPISVLPIPQLVLQYFHERDVRADDPFT